MKPNKKELDKVVVRMGKKYLTLKELKDYPIMTLAAPSEKDLKDIVLERYKMEPPDMAINIVGRGSFEVKQIIEEIRNDTELGKEIIEIEKRWIDFLVSKAQGGEIK